MFDKLLYGLLRRSVTSKLARFGWLAFFLLFPVAYIAGSLLVQRDVVQRLPTLPVARADAIARARRFLAERKIDATSWTAHAVVEPLEDLLVYYHASHSNATVDAQAFLPPLELRVLLVSSDGDIAQVVLDRIGHVAEYDLTHVKAMISGFPVTETQAAAIAKDQVERIPNLTKVLTLGKPETAPEARTPAGLCGKFEWHATTPDLPGLTFDIGEAVCGSQPVRQTIVGRVDWEHAGVHRVGRSRTLKVLVVIWIVYLAIVVVFSIYRYARRSFEGEVSYKRMLLLGGMITAALMMNFSTAIDEYVVGSYKGAHAIMWYPLAFVALGLAVVGFTIAIAYEAGEGDVRELFPGKMSSLDALMRGKIVSRNVGRSALFGAAFAAWMLLVEGLANMALRPETGSIGLDLLKLPFFRYPAFAILLGPVMIVTLIPASGLLLPLSFLHRHVKRVQLRNALLVVCGILGCFLSVSKYGSLDAAIAGVAVLTAGLLGPFLGMDFLAVMFSVGAFQVAGTMARLAAISSDWGPIAITVSVLGLGFIAAEVWGVFRGREYQEEEVRPIHARHIVERQLLQAEMLAARVAQLHLLPKSAPQINGLSISAGCVPAGAVGGDFYDFFPLDEHRLGVFIAEGGNRGIGSALTIALAKGFLMHTVRRNLSPHEIIVRLEAALGSLLHGAEETTNVAYAVFDTAAGRVHYARTGEYPKVLVSSSPAMEQRVQIPGSNKTVYEGTLVLRGGDTVLLFTDGIANRVRTTGSRAAEEVLRALARKRRENELDDDLTAVVVRVTRIGGVLEVVA